LKKAFKVFVILTILLVFSSPVLGAGTTLLVDGQEVTRNLQTRETSNGKLMLPLTVVAKALNYPVTWHKETNSVFIGNANSLYPGTSISRYYEGYPVVRIITELSELRHDVPAIVVNGRTFAPDCVLSRAFGVNITWEKQHSLVLISTKGNSQGGTLPSPRGSILYVPDDYHTIQEAIDRSMDGDEIVVKPGIYEEEINFKGKQIILRSANPNDGRIVALTAIKGGVTFEQAEGQRAMLQGFTIEGKKTGSGITVVNNSKPIIKENVIQDNQVEDAGGGIFILESSPQIIENIILRNSARHGGGIYVGTGSLPVIANNTIMNNTSTEGGGGLSVHGSYPSILKNNIAKNTSGYGGGIFVLDGEPVLSGNSFFNNVAEYDGGAIWVDRLGSVLKTNIPDDNAYLENIPNSISYK